MMQSGRFVSLEHTEAKRKEQDSFFLGIGSFQKTTSPSTNNETKRKCKQKYYIGYCSGLISARFCRAQ